MDANFWIESMKYLILTNMSIWLLILAITHYLHLLLFKLGKEWASQQRMKEAREMQIIWCHQTKLRTMLAARMILKILFLLTQHQCQIRRSFLVILRPRIDKKRIGKEIEEVCNMTKPRKILKMMVTKSTANYKVTWFVNSPFTFFNPSIFCKIWSRLMSKKS